MTTTVMQELPDDIQQDGMAIGLDIDPQVTQEKKAQRDWHYNVVILPSLRMVGFGILAIFVALHNLWILESFSWDLFSRFLVVAGSYSVITWMALLGFYQNIKWINLSVLFLILDTLIWTLAIYFSGGEKSLLFFLLILRPVDQLHTRFKYVVGFAHLSTFCYIALVGYLYLIEQRHISLPAEALKIILIYGTSIYISLAARPAENVRMRSKAAVRMARELVRKLQQQSTQLTEAKTKAEAASEAKSQFLANMSHEIRTPMNGVLGMLAILMGTELTERQQHFASTAHRSADTLLDIINDILDFSKIEAGKLELAQVDFDLRHVVEEVAEILAERAHCKGLELACRIDDSVPTTLQGDPVRLRQILINLIGNAIKFTDQGEVVVHISLLEINPNQALIRWAVSDTGMGIPYELQPHIFEAFTQADGSTTRQHNGTGLGLTIAKQLSELMGGSVGVESIPGEGATFWFTTHLVVRSTAVKLTKQSLEQLQNYRVLIVDDNATNREIVQHQLSAWGMDNTEAADGPQALTTLRGAVNHSRPYDLAILDMQMPGMDGITLARVIKADPLFSSIHLILLTSAGWHGEMNQAFQVGIAEYLNKPVRQSQLYNSIISTLNLRHQADNSLPQMSATSSLQACTGCRVLVAEDNPVNQEIAESMLQVLGCDVDRANNGQEAIEAVSRAVYDVVLMDCQMPELDGFEATALIRQQESNSHGTHLPIIALTAHVMEGDRERCLAAGMDEYLSKPFTLSQLREALNETLTRLTNPMEHQTEPSSELMLSASPALVDDLAATTVIDPATIEELRALDELRGGEVLRKVINMYLLSAPEMISAIRDAVINADEEAIRQTAHAFKSSSGHIGALNLASLCEEMETIGQQKHIEKATSTLDAITAEYEAVRESLTAL